MTIQVTSPSDEFPAPPRLALTLPDDWHALPDAALPLAAAKTVPEGHFRPNVVVVVTRVRAAYTLDQAVEATMARLTGLEGYAEIGREHLEVGGWPAFRAEVSFSDPRSGGTMAQAVRLVRVQRGPVADIVEMTGSCLAPQVEAVWPEIRAVQGSLQIDA